MKLEFDAMQLSPARRLVCRCGSEEFVVKVMVPSVEKLVQAVPPLVWYKCKCGEVVMPSDMVRCCSKVAVSEDA